MKKNFAHGDDIPFIVKTKDVDSYSDPEWMYVTSLDVEYGMNASSNKSEAMIFTNKDIPAIKKSVLLELGRLRLPVGKSEELSFIGFELEEVQ